MDYGYNWNNTPRGSINMKCFIDGNKLCIANDDFINLQESPAISIPISEKDILRVCKFERAVK